ncbi:MAG: molybdopterin biosynthesis protein [Planctomycetota bacterium]|nr:molybdopterin biosynthesis protein [Planctomycetota bacterium]
MSDQEQFLDVIDRDEAERRFRSALNLQPLGIERIAVREALGRVLAVNVLAQVDVPSFDRSNFDGYAVQAADTFGVSEIVPRAVELLPESLEAGTAPTTRIQQGQAISIATGGMLPRGADAVLMVEHAEERDGQVFVRRAVTPGFGIAFAGTDIAVGETVLRAGTVLTSRETGVLAALGEEFVDVWRQPRVTIISTGNEIIAPGERMIPAAVYDSNSQVLADAVREQGGIPLLGGIVRDHTDALRTSVLNALRESDIVLLSGGTSKGKGDLCYRVVAEFNDPGIVVHGVALKPGKPICMAVTAGKPLVILPGFPTSAIFTFHEFVAPVIRMLAGRQPETHEVVTASMAIRTNSEVGRTEYLLVGLVKTDQGLSAFPMGKGSGSVTTFSRADGFVTIPRHTEIVDAGEQVSVRLIGRGLELADLIVIGSHCVGLDYLLTRLQQRGFTSKLLTVGSSAGLMAAKRGECDVAGIHLLDADSGIYNRPFLTEAVTLIEGYGRSQGIVFRPGDARFEGRTAAEIIELARTDPTITMVNRNQGSGTRILIDRLLQTAKPAGYAVQPGNHSAVAAGITQHRADWGVAIEATANSAGLAFVPFQDEHYDFVVPNNRLHRPAVQAFVALLSDESVRQHLQSMRFSL